MTVAPHAGRRLWAGAQVAAAKATSGVAWEDLAKALGHSLVWSTSALLGQQPLDAHHPAIYRLEEAVQVYGPAVAALLAEEFGDGIMSAIDFELDFARVADPKGDRVVLTFNGKFLPYRVW